MSKYIFIDLPKQTSRISIFASMVVLYFSSGLDCSSIKIPSSRSRDPARPDPSSTTEDIESQPTSKL